jgi:hypothetical protein
LFEREGGFATQIDVLRHNNNHIVLVKVNQILHTPQNTAQTKEEPKTEAVVSFLLSPLDAEGDSVCLRQRPPLHGRTLLKQHLLQLAHVPSKLAKSFLNKTKHKTQIIPQHTNKSPDSDPIIAVVQTTPLLQRCTHTWLSVNEKEMALSSKFSQQANNAFA